MKRKCKGTVTRKTKGTFERNFLQGNLKERLEGTLVGEFDWYPSRGISNLRTGNQGERLAEHRLETLSKNPIS